MHSASRYASAKAPPSLQEARSRRRPVFDVKLFLDSAGPGRAIEDFRGKECIFVQGDPAQNVLYVQKGGVKLTVVNETGKEAVLAMLGPGDFVGEGCLLGLPFRVSTATAIMPTTALAIDKSEMMRVLHRQHAFSDHFISYVLSRSSRVEGDLIDQLFNSSEKRLARALLQLAHYGDQRLLRKELPDISQEMLAEMVGTTRSRINVFMNKFRQMGFIEYGARLRGLQINESLLGVVLHN